FAELERSLIRHQPPEPEDERAKETPTDFQRRIVAEHNTRCGRVYVPTPDVVRRAKGDGSKLLRARREAVLAARQRDPATPPTQIAAALDAPLTTILRDIEALRLGGLLPGREDGTWPTT
uniref:hypothetical protein n=1 Tax=Mangrovicoccus sp. HB161399 TaxID=2720392 RepID=UPI0015555C24